MGGLGFSSFEVGEEDERICVANKSVQIDARGGGGEYSFTNEFRDLL